jgi:MYXO-CTERM domain-containing protein
MHFVRVGAVAAAGLVLAALGSAPVAMAGVSRDAGYRDVGHAVGFHLPYTDPQQVGWLTLCNVALQSVTHGSVTGKPFVWRVVSDVPAPKGYFVKGAKAEMYAYQPVPNTPAGDWSGTQMAAPSLYSNPAHPMAQFTPIDFPLTQMTIAFPPKWDHLIELRLYLSGPGLPGYAIGYAAADVQVTGNTWTLVAGGHSSCTVGQVVSEEALVGMPGARGTPKPTPAAAAGGTASAASSSSGGSHSSGSSESAGASNQAQTTASSSNSGLDGVFIGVGASAVALLAAGGLWWRRRRRAAG